MKEKEAWTAWKPLLGKGKISFIGLAETLEGGQCFDWHKVAEAHWRGKIRLSLVEIMFSEESVFWRTYQEKPIRESELRYYFRTESSYEESIEDLPWRSDPVLAQCVDAFLGLRILRQPIEQVLLYFLLSSAKSIPQIKQMGESVCREYGTSLGLGFWSFPGWEILAKVSENKLRTLKLGYRAKYVFETAKTLREKPNWLNSLLNLSYEDAKNELLTLPGIGAKIADCVLLFGGDFLQAFPMDTWIEKSLDKRYFLKGWSKSQKAHFAKIHFGNYAGLAQQFLFSGERLGIFDTP